MISSLIPELEATVAVQAAVIAELRAANAEQARLIAELRAANAEQARLIAALQARVGELECRLGKDSSNSSKPPSSDGLRKPSRAERRADERAVRRRPGKQPGAPGAHLAQVPEPDEVVWHVPDRCGGCDAELAGAPLAGGRGTQASAGASCMVALAAISTGDTRRSRASISSRTCVDGWRTTAPGRCTPSCGHGSSMTSD